MLKRVSFGRVLGSCGILVFCYSILLIFGLIPHYDICEPNHEGSQNCYTYDLASFLFVSTVRILNDNGPLIAGLSGVAVAWFTFTLKQSTDKLWREARDQRRDARKSGLASVVAARAALRSSRAAEKSADTAERALLRLEVPHIHPIISYDPSTPIGRISVVFKNHGRSPAILVSAAIDFQITWANVYNDRPIAAFSREFIADGMVGEKESSGDFIVVHPYLEQYRELIKSGTYSLHLGTRVAWDSVIGPGRSESRSFIWHWGYGRFVGGSQLWDELQQNK